MARRTGSGASGPRSGVRDASVRTGGRPPPVLVVALLAAAAGIGCPGPAGPLRHPAPADGGAAAAADEGPTAPQDSNSAAAAGGGLRVRIGGFRSRAGKARVALFRAAAGFPAEHARAVETWVGPIPQGPLEVRFAALAPGPLAVAVIHDADDDGQLDRNLFGVPSEGFGVSNNPEPGTGPPSYAQARFDLPPEGQTITIRMRYY